MCFLCLVFSELVAGESNVKVALGAELMKVGHSSFFGTRPTASNPGKKAVPGNFAGAEWFPFLHKSEVKVACTDAISKMN